MADFTQTISEDSDDYDRIISIYQQLAASGYEEDARGILEGVWDPDHMTSFEMGQISFFLGKNAEAQNYLEQARNEKNGSDKTAVILLLGQTAENQNDYNYAVSVYKSFLADNPQNAEIYNRLGLCEIEMAQNSNDASYYKAAIADFEAGIALGDPEETQALMRNEVTAYEYSGEFASARELMGKYLEKYPGDTEAQREAEFLSTR
jgi:tetratricopeptide (TPR) repeat protein